MPNKATSVLVRAELTGFLLEHPGTQNYIATEIMPVMSVPEKNGHFLKVPREAMLTLQKVARSPKGSYHRSDFAMEDDTWACKEYGHEEPMDDGEARMYRRHGQYDEVLAVRARAILLLQQEARMKTICHNTTTFTQSGNTGLAVTNEWDDNANATPIDDVQAGKAGIRARGGPTDNLKLQISWGTWGDLWRCDQILQNIKYVVGGTTPDQMDMAARATMAQQLGVKQIIVADAYYNSAVEGETPVIADIWTGEYAFLFNAPTGADINTPCFGRTMAWDEDGGLFTAEPYREDATRGDVIRVRQHVQEKTLLTEEAFLFSNIIT